CVLHHSLSSGRSANPALHSFPTRRSSDLQLISSNLNTNMDTMKNMAYVLGTLVLVSCGTKTTTKAPDATTTEAAAVEVNEIETRSEEHTSELQSRENLVCRLLLEKKKTES